MPFRKGKLINPTIMRGVYLSVLANPITNYGFLYFTSVFTLNQSHLRIIQQREDFVQSGRK